MKFKDSLARCLTLSFIALSALLTRAMALPQNDDKGWNCPELPRKYSVGKYKFSYNSWKWRDGQDNIKIKFCHCVRNESQAGLFIEWDATGISGFVRPYETNYIVEEHSSDKFSLAKRNLWYGTQPKRIIVETLHPDSKSNDEVISISSKTHIPFGSLNGATTKKELTSYIRANPHLLSAFELRFTAKIDRSSGKMYLKCDYKIDVSSNAWPENYALKFDDPILNVVMFGSESQVVSKGYRWFNGYVSGRGRYFYPKGNGYTFAAVVKIPSQHSAATKMQTHLKIIGEKSGIEAARLPVAFYHFTEK